MKILFMGSAAFAVPSLDALHNAGYEITKVVTQPDKPAGRGQKLTSCPAANEAKQLGLQLYQPRSVKSEKVLNKLLDDKPDMIVVVAYGKLLPKKLIDFPKSGTINLHSSLLPKYRGAAPINWAIVNGEKKSGVTTMFISEELDAGDILLSKDVDINDDETSVDLHDRLAPIGAQLLIETIEKIRKGSIKPAPQNHSRASFAPLIKKEDGLINWSANHETIINLIRGMQPWPSAFTHYEGKMLRIFAAKPTSEKSGFKPGTITIQNGTALVSTGTVDISLLELQIEGKRRMSISDFLNGHKISDGTILE